MNDQKKQLIINIITIIGIILIIILAYNLIVNSKYSQRFAKELLEKNTQTYNYKFEKKEYFNKTGEEKVTKVIQKEDARRVENSNGSITWLANDYCIMCDSNSKIYFKTIMHPAMGDNSSQDIKYRTTKQDLIILQGEFNWLINGNSVYKYVGKEKYNDKECIVVEFDRSDRIQTTKKTKQWIDLDTGLILKEEQYENNELVETIQYIVEINTVTDQDIDLPNLNEYTYQGEK